MLGRGLTVPQKRWRVFVSTLRGRDSRLDTFCLFIHTKYVLEVHRNGPRLLTKLLVNGSQPWVFLNLADVLVKIEENLVLVFTNFRYRVLTHRGCLWFQRED